MSRFEWSVRDHDLLDYTFDTRAFGTEDARMELCFRAANNANLAPCNVVTSGIANGTVPANTRKILIGGQFGVDASFELRIG